MGQLKDKQFDIVLTNQRKLWLLFSAWVIAVVSVSAAGSYLLDNPSKTTGFIGVSLLAGGLFVLLRLIQKQAANPVRITISTDYPTVLNLKSQVESSVQFDGIAAYRFSSVFPEQYFVLTTRKGSKLSLFVNTRVHAASCLPDFVTHFELALRRWEAKRSLSEEPFAVKEKPFEFFQMPQATVGFIVGATLMSGLTWRLITSARQPPFIIFLLCGLLLVYLVVWAVVRLRR